MNADEKQLHTLVRRTRRSLEALRQCKAAARGVLAGGAAGLALLIVGSFVPALDAGAAVAWTLPAAGAVAFLLRALLAGRKISPQAAALFLDDRLGTKQRIVTLVSMPNHEFAARVAEGVDADAKRPGLPMPREFAAVPAALFLLFGATLIATANAEEASEPNSDTPRSESTLPAGVDPSEEAAPSIDPVADRLAAGEPPTPEEAAALRRYIEARLHRPEDRREAREAIDKAQRGDAQAIREVSDAVARGEGGSGELEHRKKKNGSASEAPGRTNERETPNGARAPSAYPEAREVVRAYRKALAEEASR